MQRKIRVLHVYKTFYPMTQGGIQESIRQICLNTHARGVESRVLTLTPSPVGHPIRVDDIEVYQAKQLFELASCGFSLSALTQFGQLARWADVLHYHFPWPFADLLHFLRRPDKPSVVTYHSDIVRQRHLSKVYAPLMHAFLDATDIIVPTSPNYTRSSPILRRFRNKLRVIPLGLNECRYPPPGRACPLPFEDREEFFLFVGVFRAYKGLHILLEAAQNASFKVVIAGRGPMEKRLKAQARRLNLDNVFFLGHISDEQKIDLMRRCRAVVLPSHLRSEAFGLSLLEGAMQARPLICTDLHTGTSFVNIHEQTGIVVPSGDPEALRAAMDRLWDNPSLARSMGQAARNRFETHFSGTVMGEQYFDLYSGLAAPRAHAG